MAGRSLLDEIRAYIEKEAKTPYLKLLFTKSNRIDRINGYQGKIASAITAFQVHD